MALLLGGNLGTLGLLTDIPLGDGIRRSLGRFFSGAASAECGCRVVGRMAEAERRTGARLYGSARSGAEPRQPPDEDGGCDVPWTATVKLSWSVATSSESEVCGIARL